MQWKFPKRNYLTAYQAGRIITSGTDKNMKNIRSVDQVGSSQDFPQLDNILVFPLRNLLLSSPLR